MVMIADKPAFLGKPYLKAQDITQEEKLTIAKVYQNEKSLKMSDKLFCEFEELNYVFVLNKTNQRKMVEIFGSPNTDNWIGKTIVLYTAMVVFNGKELPGIRVKAA